MFNILKQIFTWWNKQTIGTFIYTVFRGKFVGKDKFGNKYYNDSKNKRWVIYKKQVEATKIPPDWYSWIHFISDKIPVNEKLQYEWQQEHSENLTGTSKAYKPEGALSSKVLKSTKKYTTWKP